MRKLRLTQVTCVLETDQIKTDKESKQDSRKGNHILYPALLMSSVCLSYFSGFCNKMPNTHQLKEERFI